jgi:hypothetical protein
MTLVDSILIMSTELIEKVASESSREVKNRPVLKKALEQDTPEVRNFLLDD